MTLFHTAQTLTADGENERRGEVVETQRVAWAGDCHELQKTEQGALGSKGCHAAAWYVALSPSKTMGGGR